MSVVFPDYEEASSLDRQVAQLRIPPHSLEAESSVIGGLLLDNTAWDKIGDVLIDADFYRYEHRLVFSSVSTLINANRAADVITVFEHLQTQGKADEIGGLAYLNSLAQYVPSSANIRRYAEIVRERSILRKLISVSDEIATSAMSTKGKPVPLILDEAEQKIFNIGEEGARMRQGFQSMGNLVVQLLDRVEEMSQNPNDITGVPTGFHDLDRMTSGMQPGDLIVLAARPSMGKTAFAMNIAEHVAIDGNKPVAVFSLEMSSQQLVQRLLCSRARVNGQKIREGFFGKHEMTSISVTAGVLSKAKIFVDDTPGLSILELRAKARRLRNREKIELIVIDYLQLLRSNSKRGQDNRQIEIQEISYGIKALAKELKIPVIVLAQLNRNPEQRTGDGKGRPRLSDLRESGTIEQDADVVGLLVREKYYAEDDESKKEAAGKATLIIAKQRNGPTGDINLTFLEEYTRFEERADDRREDQ
jgi:replicative DNA helicase